MVINVSSGRWRCYPPYRHISSMRMSGYCMVTHLARVWINRVRLPILLMVSWNGKMDISLSAFAPENLGSRDGFGSPVPPACSSPYSGWIWCLLTGFLSSSAAASIYLFKNRHTPSGQSRVYRVTQLRTGRVHCRESALTGPVNFKVVPNECCVGRSPWTN